MFKFNSYISSENLGASFSEALDRYKRYERKLDDQVRPNEDTLRKLSNAPYKIQSATAIKTNFTLFPNGERNVGNKEKDVSVSSDLLNDYEYLSDSTNDIIPKYKSEKLDLSNGKKALPTIAKSRPIRGNSSISKNDKKKNNSNKAQNCYTENSNDENSECEDNSYLNDTKQSDLEKSQEIVYKLSTVINYLDQGYFLRLIIKK